MGLFSFLSASAITVPDFKWGLDWFINVLTNAIGSAGVAVIIFTLIIKLILSPLDFFSKRQMRLNGLKMDRMRPQLDKIQKQYAGRKDLLNQKTMQLYKKEGYSMMGACLPQLISIGLFFYVFAAFRRFADISNIVFFKKIQDAYLADPASVQGVFDANVQSFFWVKNIWRPDTWVSIMPTAEQFISGGLGMNGVGGTAITIQEYNDIIKQIDFGSRGNAWNGYMILPIIAIGVSFLSSWLMKKQNREMQASMPNGQSGAGMQKVMMWLMPIMMGIFAFMYTTAFTIYMVSNSIITLGMNALLTFIVNKRYKELKPKKSEQPKAGYMR